MFSESLLNVDDVDHDKQRQKIVCGHDVGQTLSLLANAFT